jgi:hypothetical protein
MHVQERILVLPQPVGFIGCFFFYIYRRKLHRLHDQYSDVIHHGLLLDVLTQDTATKATLRHVRKLWIMSNNSDSMVVNCLRVVKYTGKMAKSMMRHKHSYSYEDP